MNKRASFKAVKSDLFNNVAADFTSVLTVKSLVTILFSNGVEKTLGSTMLPEDFLYVWNNTKKELSFVSDDNSYVTIDKKSVAFISAKLK